ncbi:hypothetical protein GLOTRDRAFT_141488 [Gloeophyllum trabeum ATCC 11539]|uniref:Large ribosomal subunit protein bL28c n=1 Tax=Gloeophyllum trabeum (strain ATCC 11539 / FP-39264 / Madison 617) TaxID=670483 RepID=S7PT36_GLOTA|nr:uncharacterized protein GLOTRDRAFT_141488 [Gloeophyllum trabeum ATCC 11539]EPQ50548.1 hypothetical protein GLOTRDRAFT_141488 [Gloeophyllum trabeum ATCC 11539]
MLPSIPLFSAVVSQPFKRSQLGLFHGKMKQSGNSVPFSKNKTKRTWLPNVHTKRIFSEALGEKIKLKLTTKAMRTIKKYGGLERGLDAYLLKTKSDYLGYEGMRLRVLVEEKLAQKSLGAQAPAAEAAQPSVTEVLPESPSSPVEGAPTA